MKACSIIHTNGLNSGIATQLKIDAGGREAENHIWFVYEVVRLVSEMMNYESWDEDLELFRLVALKFLVSIGIDQ
jgi:hypothetical protein